MKVTSPGGLQVVLVRFHSQVPHSDRVLDKSQMGKCIAYREAWLAGNSSLYFSMPRKNKPHSTTQARWQSWEVQDSLLRTEVIVIRTVYKSRVVSLDILFFEVKHEPPHWKVYCASPAGQTHPSAATILRLLCVFSINSSICTPERDTLTMVQTAAKAASPQRLCVMPAVCLEIRKEWEWVVAIPV